MEVGGIVGDQLKAFVERYERLQEDADAISGDKGELMGEVAAHGFDKKVFKILIKRRRMGKDACDEEDTLVELYERALAEKPARPRARTRKREEAAETAEAVS